MDAKWQAWQQQLARAERARQQANLAWEQAAKQNDQDKQQEEK